MSGLFLSTAPFQMNTIDATKRNIMTTKKGDSRKWRPATQLIRGGLERSQFDETSESLYMTSGYVYSSPEEAQLAFKGEKERFLLALR